MKLDVPDPVITVEAQWVDNEHPLRVLRVSYKGVVLVNGEQVFETEAFHGGEFGGSDPADDAKKAASRALADGLRRLLNPATS